MRLAGFPSARPGPRQRADEKGTEGRKGKGDDFWDNRFRTWAWGDCRTGPGGCRRVGQREVPTGVCAESGWDAGAAEIYASGHRMTCPLVHGLLQMHAARVASSIKPGERQRLIGGAEASIAENLEGAPYFARCVAAVHNAIDETDTQAAVDLHQVESFLGDMGTD